MLLIRIILFFALFVNSSLLDSSLFSSSEDCTNQSDGSQCGSIFKNKICQDSLCICERYDHIFCKNCGLPKFNNFYHHDDSIISIKFDFEVMFYKHVHHSFGFNEFEFNEFELNKINNEIDSEIEHKLIIELNKFNNEIDYKIDNKIDDKIHNEIIESIDNKQHDGSKNELMNNGSITLLNNKLGIIDMNIGNATLKFRSYQNKSQLCVTYLTHSSFGDHFFPKCENKCFDIIDENIRFSYYESNCHGYTMPDGCVTTTYEVTMKVTNIKYDEKKSFIHTTTIRDKMKHVCVHGERCKSKFDSSINGYADCHHGMCVCDNFDTFVCDNCGLMWHNASINQTLGEYDDSVKSITLNQIIHYKHNDYESQINLTNNVPRAIQLGNNVRAVIGFRSMNKQIELFTSHYDNKKEECVHNRWPNIQNMNCYWMKKDNIILLDNFYERRGNSYSCDAQSLSLELTHVSTNDNNNNNFECVLPFILYLLNQL